MRALVFFCLSLLSMSSYSQARRALSLIEKDKRTEAYELLVRSINKDSLASAEHFVLSVLYVDEAFSYYDIDTAYFHVQTAKDEYARLEEKQQQRLSGNGFELATYDTLQKFIETAAFERARSLGRESDYISFMQSFPEADQLDSAIFFRNADAYQQAKQLDTYEAYQGFFGKYPQAADAEEARTRYHRLLYEVKTSSGKLADLRKFLVEYPDTRHRQEVEKQIFIIMTGQNTISAYLSFISAHPDSYLAERAKLRAFNLAPLGQQEALLSKLALSDETIDSLQTLALVNNQMLILTHDGSQYEIMRADGSVMLSSLDEIAEQNKCDEISKLLLVKEPGRNRLVNLAGNEVESGNINGYSIIEPGFIKLVTEQGVEIIHFDGSPTTKRQYRQAEMLGGYIIYKENQLWGIESITGIPMIEPRFDTLFEFSGQLVITEDGHWGIHSKESLYPLLDGTEVKLEFPYDNISPVRQGTLLVELGDQNGLLDQNLNWLIPLGEAMIELLEDGYFLETNDSILDSRLADTWYSDISSNDKWTIGLRKETNDLYFNGEKVLEVVEAELLGKSAVIVSNDDKTFCYFNPQSKLELGEGEAIRPVRKMGENSVIRHYLYTDQRNKQAVIDERGKRIKIPRFDRLIDLGEDYMIFSVKGFVYNILDNKGNVILENVDAATSLDSGYISYLSKGKFGLLNIRNKTLIKPKYDKPLERYDSKRFVVAEDGLLGLIDRHDSLYIEPKYEEIQQLNDSIAVLKANFRWTFWNLNEGRIILDNVSGYWEYATDAGVFFKIFKGIGYGIWQPEAGLILNSTYDELSIKANSNDLVFITEKWVEEAELVVLLYYDGRGELIRKSVLTTRQYEDLQCQPDF